MLHRYHEKNIELSSNSTVLNDLPPSPNGAYSE
jgi:hypothetical protein